MEYTAAKPVPENQRIRGPSLAVLITRNKGAPFEEGLARANAENRVIASNKRVNRALLGKGRWGSNEYKPVAAAFKCWTGTMTAYGAPGEKLGKAIEYVDPKTSYCWLFLVPEEHQGKKNRILVAEHPDYTLEIDGKYRIVHAVKVDAVKSFPAETLRMRSRLGSLRTLERRVGPVSRVCHHNRYHDSRGSVDIQTRPSFALGMLVEAEEQELNVMGFHKKLIVEGTPEQLEAATRLLEQLKQ
jgi:hypothetical protein